MTSVYTKADKIVSTALGILAREQILLGLVTPYTVNDFRYAKNDTITVPIRARATAHQQAMRATGTDRQIIVDDLTESSVAVKLDTTVYNAIGITDEESTLDIVSFSEQVLQPQVLAVTEYIENLCYGIIKNANYKADHVLAWDTVGTPAYQAALQARKVLNLSNVPQAGRVLLVGPNAEMAILGDERLDSANPEGLGQSALREATIGRFAGFTVVTSNLVPDNEAYAFHKSAFSFANVAPVIPQGAKAGAIKSYNGISLRWIADYDSNISTDRSVLMTYVGGAATDDGPVVSTKKTVVRAVKLNVS